MFIRINNFNNRIRAAYTDSAAFTNCHLNDCIFAATQAVLIKTGGILII